MTSKIKDDKASRVTASTANGRASPRHETETQPTRFGSLCTTPLNVSGFEHPKRSRSHTIRSRPLTIRFFTSDQRRAKDPLRQRPQGPPVTMRPTHKIHQINLSSPRFINHQCRSSAAYRTTRPRDNTLGSHPFHQHQPTTDTARALLVAPNHEK